MLESAVREIKYKHPLKSQDRIEWYRMGFLIKSMGQTAASLEMLPQDIVHLGGTACFYRCYEAFGPLAISHFRGTHDLDLLSFTPGAVQRVLDRMVNTTGLGVEDYTVCRSSSLPNKKSVELELASANDPKLRKGLRVDIFESQNGHVKWNDRFFTHDKIVFDAPELLKLPERWGMVAVPSLRDNFVLKMEVVDFSQCGLRPKDIFDILATLKVADIIGIDFRGLVGSLIEDNHEREKEVCRRKDICTSQQNRLLGDLSRSLVRKLSMLEMALSKPSCVMDNVPADCPFLPSSSRANEVLGVVKRTKSLLTRN